MMKGQEHILLLMLYPNQLAIFYVSKCSFGFSYYACTRSLHSFMMTSSLITIFSSQGKYFLNIQAEYTLKLVIEENLLNLDDKQFDMWQPAVGVVLFTYGEDEVAVIHRI